ncbi:MAG: biotin--[Clostridia bacterium]|nr:biotin--[acetyl-CoA-carboxylase] ligase [Clostridia bacterium]
MTLREELLYELERARLTGEVSGEELAKKLGVSRVAVWKAVGKLTEEGFEIDPVKGKGYRLSYAPQVLSEGRIRALLPPALSDMPVFVYNETSSTNDRAKEAASKGVRRALFISDRQTAGRGRLGRSFYSPAGVGVYFTYLFTSVRPVEELCPVTPFAAVSVSRAVSELCGIEVGIKWVNDLYLDGKKVCGILSEAITSLEGGDENKIAVGIGINLTTGAFPEELQKKAGALGAPVDRCALAAKIASMLFKFEEDPLDRSFMAEYTARSTVLGKTVELDRWGEKTVGKVTGFDRNGALILDTGDGQKRTYSGGEISLREVKGGA